jgi:hypothetical protein
VESVPFPNPWLFGSVKFSISRTKFFCKLYRPRRPPVQAEATAAHGVALSSTANYLLATGTVCRLDIIYAAVNGHADAIVTFNLRDYGDIPGKFGIDVLLPAIVIRRVRNE